MFGIGAFARLAQVSVRTLHHYDELGLLPPARVDQVTGYRWYSAEQLARLNRILALRDLGFPLAWIRGIVDESVSPEELRGMLRLRRAEVDERIAAERERLARIEERLRRIETEEDMSGYDIVMKPLAPQRVAFIQEQAPAFGESLGPIFGRLYPELYRELARLGVTAAGPQLAWYEDSGDDELPILVAAAVPVDVDTDLTSDRVRVTDIPAVPRAAATIHKGPMSTVSDGYEALLRWSSETGEQVDGYSREVYLECDGPESTWVTELQFALRSTPGSSTPAGS